MDYNQKYDIDTICVNQDEKIERAKGVIRKLHPTMICQTACHIEGFVENEAENLPNISLVSIPPLTMTTDTKSKNAIGNRTNSDSNVSKLKLSSIDHGINGITPTNKIGLRHIEVLGSPSSIEHHPIPSALPASFGTTKSKEASVGEGLQTDPSNLRSTFRAPITDLSSKGMEYTK